jgi:hypothetical protein
MKPRLLANENFPAPSVQHLRERGTTASAVALRDDISPAKAFGCGLMPVRRI